MEKTGPTVCQVSESIGFVYFCCICQIHFCIFFLSFFLFLGLYVLFFRVLVCFQQREPFKKRWFTLCSGNRKLLYFKSPLVINT